MPDINPSLPTVGQPDSTEEPKIVTAFQAIVSAINDIDGANITDGAIEAADLSSTLLDYLGVTSGSTRRGKKITATEESTTSASYTTLTTADTVSGIVMPTDGLIAIAYQAMWKESVANAARAAIFLGANQLKTASAFTTVQSEAAIVNNTAGNYTPLATGPFGLHSGGSGAYTGDATTGQAVGLVVTNNTIELTSGTGTYYSAGGVCYVFAAAGTYDISVKFKTSSGTVYAKNRKLWVWTMGF